MKNNFESMIHKAKQEKLTLRERELMRAGVEDFVRDHPMRTFPSLSSDYSWFVFLSRHAVTVTMVGVLFFAGGLSLSAEGAVPGDPLYGVKTGVNEKVLGLFATSPEAKAEWELSLADRRLNEIATLTKEQKLTPEVESELEAKAEFHTALALGTSTDTLSGDQNASTSMPHFFAPVTTASLKMTQNGEDGAGHLSLRSATTTFEGNDILGLQATIALRKQSVDTRRVEFEHSKTFVKNKAAVLTAERLSLQAEGARNNGNEEGAQRLAGEARAVLSHNPLPGSELQTPDISPVVPTQGEGDGHGN